MFEYLVSNWWAVSEDLRGVALLEEVCPWEWALEVAGQVQCHSVS